MAKSEIGREKRERERERNSSGAHSKGDGIDDSNPFPCLGKEKFNFAACYFVS